MSISGGNVIVKVLALIAVIATAVALWLLPKVPPVFVEFRKGILSDQVLVVRNISKETLTGTVALFKPNDPKGKGFPLLLMPGERREFGVLQVGDYAPAAGSHGYIDIDGYIFVRQFEIVDKETFSDSALPWILAH